MEGDIRFQKLGIIGFRLENFVPRSQTIYHNLNFINIKVSPTPKAKSPIQVGAGRVQKIVRGEKKNMKKKISFLNVI